MAVPFGFSVGDVIAGINLLVTSIQAIRDSTGASTEYRAVAATLKQVSFALEGLNELQFDDTSQRHAVEVAASNCGTTIFQFVSKISKYKASLESRSVLKNWKAILRKIEWSLYSKEEIRTFQAQLQGDLLALQTTLARINLAISFANARTTQTVLIKVDSRLDEANTTRQLILETLSRCFAECRELLMIVFLNNMRIIDFLLSGQQLYSKVQEERPTYLEDPHGRIIPIPRSWISDWEDFESILQIQFKKVPGLKKIRRREYILHDIVRSSEIVHSMPAESIFRPGRRIVMTMIAKGWQLPGLCPRCFKALNCVKDHGPEAMCSSFRTQDTILADGCKGTDTCVPNPVIPIWDYEEWLRNTASTLSETIISKAVIRATRAKPGFSWDCSTAFTRWKLVPVSRGRMYHHDLGAMKMLNSTSPGFKDTDKLRIPGDDALLVRLHQYSLDHQHHDEQFDYQRLTEELLPLDVDHGYMDAIRRFSHTIVREAISLYREVFTDIETWWEEKDYDTVCMLIDHFKGSIGLIGLTEAEDTFKSFFPLRFEPNSDERIGAIRQLIDRAKCQVKDGYRILAVIFEISEEELTLLMSI